MRTCKSCGCYIPDLWSECPACGRVLHDGGNLGNVEPDAEIIWSSDPNVKPYPIELESHWPWSEIKLHQGTNK